MDSNFIFTTEGHILPLPKRYLKQQQHDKQSKDSSSNKNRNPIVSLQSTPSGTCQRYNPSKLRYLSTPGQLDMSSIPYQPQTDYASDIVGYTSASIPPLSKNGYCQSPLTAQKTFSLSFGGLNDYSQVRYKSNNIIEMLGGYLVKSLSGLRIEVVSNAGAKDGYLVKGG
jgi:mannosidase alpha-like ER degradation enhancer 1